MANYKRRQQLLMLLILYKCNKHIPSTGILQGNSNSHKERKIFYKLINTADHFQKVKIWP